MCLIIHRPTGRDIPQDWLDNGMTQNPDGWGIMASDGMRLNIARGFGQKPFRKALKRFREMEIFIHFRNATHGNVDISNCHPFLIVNDRFAVMHNGIIGIDTSSDTSKSDTWHYCDAILAPMFGQDPDALRDPRFCELIGKHVGRENKLTILRSDGVHAIVNRREGTELRGCWLSNIWSIGMTCRRSSLDLRDLATLERDELIELCQYNPEEVADAILDNMGGY